MKITRMCALLGLALIITLGGGLSQSGLADETIAGRFLRTVYEVEDYASIPQEIVERNLQEIFEKNLSNELKNRIENATGELGIIGTVEDAESRAFLSERFSSLCSAEIIDEMLANLIVLEYYQVLGSSGFNAVVEEIVLTKMASSDPAASMKLYAYDLTIRVQRSSSGEESESDLSGRIATDMVDNAEVVVYMNYGKKIFPEYPQ